MSNLNEVVNAMFEKQPTPDELELRQLAEQLFSEANRLLTIMERPENREIFRFALSWSKFERSLEALKSSVNARLRQIRESEADPADPLAVFFQN